MAVPSRKVSSRPPKIRIVVDGFLSALTDGAGRTSFAPRSYGQRTYPLVPFHRHQSDKDVAEVDVPLTNHYPMCYRRALSRTGRGYNGTMKSQVKLPVIVKTVDGKMGGTSCPPFGRVAVQT
jgi:hypothetical protein